MYIFYLKNNSHIWENIIYLFKAIIVFVCINGKIVSFFLLFVANICFAQIAKKQNEMNVKNKMEARQLQDPSVPSPPVNSFPAQYPKGNRVFLQLVEKNINKESLKGLPKKLETKIIIKINDDGTVLNISTYGEYEVFNKEVENAAKKIGTTKWTAGKSRQGENVNDLVKLPLRLLINKIPNKTL
ncbi:TonB C-terminal domain-containing protein [Elizabethkingia occulta]